MGVLKTPPRYELKYLIRHDLAHTLVRRLSDACEPDPYSGTTGYLVNSLYYDTADLRAYREKIDGVSPRFKVRARYYGAEALESPKANGSVYLEVKQRIGDRIVKWRRPYSREAWRHLAASAPLFMPEDGDQSDPGGHLPNRVNARPLFPVCRVTYRRLAYLSRVKSRLRITLDVHLRSGGATSTPGADVQAGTVFLPPHLAILEIKFPFVLPSWISEICRSLGLEQRRYSKYCSAIEALFPAASDRALRMRRWIA